VTLLAFAAVRRAAAAAVLRRPVAAASVDTWPPGRQQHTHRIGMQRLMDGADGLADRQTDGRTPCRYIDPFAYHASRVNNNKLLQ